jgi:hypothetical protein
VIIGELAAHWLTVFVSPFLIRNFATKHTCLLFEDSQSLSIFVGDHP